MVIYELSILPYVLMLAAVVAGLVGGLALARRDSTLRMRLQSIAQRTQLANVRLGRLLRCCHIGIGDYFQAFPLVEIRRQVAVCKRCPSETRCDQAFAAHQTAYPFCPNRAALERFVSRSANVMDDAGA